MNLTQAIVEYIGGFSTRDPEPAVRRQAKRHLADTFACIVCGTPEPGAERIREYISRNPVSGGSPLLFHETLRVSPAAAAFYYGICAHICDSDDLSKNLQGHPGAIVLPVVLAVGTAQNRTGEECLRAYVAGVEAAAAIGKGFHQTGLSPNWNPTTVLGIFGGVAAACLLMRLSPAQTAAALGIAASESSGLKVNYGSSAKDITVGSAAAKAVLAAELAAWGVEANEDALGAKDGLFATLAPAFREDAIRTALTDGSSDFLHPGIILKPYPACRGVHNGIDGALTLRELHGLTGGEIASITCLVQPTVLEADRYPVPQTPAEGKFSLGYCIALAILNGQVVADDFSDKGKLNPEALALGKRVEVQVDETFTPNNAKSGIEVVLRTGSGEEYRHRGHFAKGDPNNPLTDAEHHKKLSQCLSRRMSPGAADAMLTRLECFEEQSLEEIYSLCKA